MGGFSLLAIPCCYLIGSFPSSYLVGRFWGKVNLLKQGDGHISATAVFREVGRAAFILAIIMDVGKAFAAIKLASLFTNSMGIILAAGLAAIIGHCWPIYIRFRGGLGAVVTYGVLATLAFIPFAMGAAVAVVLLLLTHKSTLSTYALLATAAVVMLIQGQETILALSPVIMVSIQLLKRLQVRKEAASAYNNELFHDLRRSR